MKKKMLVIGSVLAVTSATVAVAAGVSGKGQGFPANLGSDKYSIAQTVINNSNETLTLSAIPSVDNGAAMEDGYPGSIAPHSSGVYKAYNYGNGVQMWLYFAGSDGAIVSVNTDVPKVQANNTRASVTANGAIISDLNISFGDNATSSATISAKATNGVKTTRLNFGADPW